MQTDPARPHNITIRRLGLAEAEIYRTLRLEGLRAAPSAFGSSYEVECDRPLEWFAQRVSDRLVLGGSLDGGLSVSGIVGLAVETNLKERHKGTIWGMYVQPAARGTGLAAALLGAAINHAREVVEELRITAGADNLPALNLYRRFGFQEYGREPRALKIATGYIDEVLMALRLRQD